MKKIIKVFCWHDDKYSVGSEITKKNEDNIMPNKLTKKTLIAGGLFDLAVVAFAIAAFLGYVPLTVAVPGFMAIAAVYGYFAYKTIKTLRSR